jgi:hypothetical protein
MSIKSTVLSSLAVQNRFHIKPADFPLIKDLLPLAADENALLHFYYDLVLGQIEPVEIEHLEPGRWQLFQADTFDFLRGLFEHCEQLAEADQTGSN